MLTTIKILSVPHLTDRMELLLPRTDDLIHGILSNWLFRRFSLARESDFSRGDERSGLVFASVVAPTIPQWLHNPIPDECRDNRNDQILLCENILQVPQ